MKTLTSLFSTVKNLHLQKFLTSNYREGVNTFLLIFVYYSKIISSNGKVIKPAFWSVIYLAISLWDHRNLILAEDSFVSSEEIFIVLRRCYHSTTYYFVIWHGILTRNFFNISQNEQIGMGYIYYTIGYMFYM